MEQFIKHIANILTFSQTKMAAEITLTIYNTSNASEFTPCI